MHAAPSVSSLQIFRFNDADVRIQADLNGQPWFNANDVCAALEFGNTRQAIVSHVDEDDVQKLDTIDSLGRAQRTNYINESGLYALIFGSTKETAKQFKRWVTSEVLPAIRKNGGYAHAALSPSRLVLRLAEIVGRLRANYPEGEAHALANGILLEETGVDVMARFFPQEMRARLAQEGRRKQDSALGRILRLLENPGRLAGWKGVCGNPALLAVLEGGGVPHQLLLQASHLRADDFRALVAQAVADRLVAECRYPGYAGRVYVKGERA